MMAQVTQTLKLEDTPKINSRFFDEGKRLYAHVFARVRTLPSVVPVSWLGSLLGPVKPLLTSQLSGLWCSGCGRH